MSRSPERMSSYRRHFEEVAPAYVLRVSSPSPTRTETRHRSASFTRGGRMMGRRDKSRWVQTWSYVYPSICSQHNFRYNIIIIK